MSDGFELMSLPEVAEEAEATPSDYIGIVTERMFARYPDAGLHYVRGSSGFAGFSRGGFTRAAITRFHQEMEKLVGIKRWREWGTEQCGSNFAIANSPGAFVLPYPEYASFTPHVARREAKFFHFIGANRFRDDYYAARGQELIAKLHPGSVPTISVRQTGPARGCLAARLYAGANSPAQRATLAGALGANVVTCGCGCAPDTSFPDRNFNCVRIPRATTMRVWPTRSSFTNICGHQSEFHPSGSS